MDVAAFIASFRASTTDTEPTYKWADAEVLEYLNDAVNEACERALLIEDRTTPTCCQVTLATGIDTYALHASVIKVKRVVWDGRAIDETSVEEMDNADASWEARTGKPQAYILGDGTLRIVPTPTATENGQLLRLTVARRPLLPRTLGAPDNTALELNERYCQRLMNWALSRAYMKRDAETLNKAKAEEHLALFVADFGVRPDANVQRKQRDRRPPVVRFQW